jgi:methylmalonyl-CoA mutase C-terminal domain/subunit
MKERDLNDMLVVVGGVIPARDNPLLEGMGIQGIFPGGTRFEEMIQYIEEHAGS